MIYGTFAWVDCPAMGRGLNSSRAIPLAYMPSSHCQNITTTNTFCQLKGVTPDFRPDFENLGLFNRWR